MKHIDTKQINKLQIWKPINNKQGTIPEKQKHQTNKQGIETETYKLQTKKTSYKYENTQTNKLLRWKHSSDKQINKLKDVNT